MRALEGCCRGSVVWWKLFVRFVDVVSLRSGVWVGWNGYDEGDYQKGHVVHIRNRPSQTHHQFTEFTGYVSLKCFQVIMRNMMQRSHLHENT